MYRKECASLFQQAVTAPVLAYQAGGGKGCFHALMGLLHCSVVYVLSCSSHCSKHVCILKSADCITVTATQLKECALSVCLYINALAWHQHH